MPQQGGMLSHSCLRRCKPCVMFKIRYDSKRRLVHHAWFLLRLSSSENFGFSPVIAQMSCFASISFLATISDSGPALTIKLITSYKMSAAAMVVSSALVSYAGATYDSGPRQSHHSPTPYRVFTYFNDIASH